MKKAVLILTLGAFVASAGTALAGTSFVGGGAPLTIATETFTTLGTFLPLDRPVNHPTFSCISASRRGISPQASRRFVISSVVLWSR